MSTRARLCARCVKFGTEYSDIFCSAGCARLHSLIWRIKKGVPPFHSARNECHQNAEGFFLHFIDVSLEIRVKQIQMLKRSAGFGTVPVS